MDKRHKYSIGGRHDSVLSGPAFALSQMCHFCLTIISGPTEPYVSGSLTEPSSCWSFLLHGWFMSHNRCSFSIKTQEQISCYFLSGVQFSVKDDTVVLQKSKGLCYDYPHRTCYKFHKFFFSITDISTTKVCDPHLKGCFLKSPTATGL